MAMTSDLVSSTIAARAREPEGLRKMMMVSAVAHSIAIVALVIGPWLFGTPRPEETIMVVSFDAGAPGADTGGMTALSARAVQKVEPKDELPKPTRPTPPAAQTPAMVEPIAKPTPAKPAQRQPSTVDQGGAAVDRRDGASGPVEGGNRIDVERRRPVHRRHGRRQQPGERQLLRSAVPRADGVADLRQLEARHRRRREARSSAS